MNGILAYPAKAVGPDIYELWGSFQCNGSSDPIALRSARGFRWTVTYTATGLYTVTIASDLGALANAPLSILATPECTDLTNYFQVMVVGGNTLNASGRQFAIQAHRAGTANEPAAAATARINFALCANESTGA